MYVNITGSANNKDVYIYQSYRKENGKTSSRIYRKLGKLNDLLARFDGDKDKMMGDTFHYKPAAVTMQAELICEAVDKLLGLTGSDIVQQSTETGPLGRL